MTAIHLHKACPPQWGEVKEAILAVLKEAPSGKTIRQVAALVDRSPSRVATRLAELRDTCRVISALSADGKGSKLWFHPDHAAAAAALMPDAPKQGRRKTTVAQVPQPERVRLPGGPVMTIAPPFVDRRWVVENPAQVFSALKPGQYPLTTGTVIGRAYGERS